MTKRKLATARNVLILPLLWMLADVALVAAAQAESAASIRSASSNATIAFDLDAAPLAVALERFMSATSVAVVVDSALLMERRSAAVRGNYTAETALRIMVTGAGLNVVAIGQSAFTLLPPSPGARPLPGNLQFAGAVQAAVTAALCQQGDTRLMQYRTVLRLWLDAAGAVVRVELASSTGDSKVDMTIARTLQHVDVGMPRPGGLPQPVKLVILPDTGGPACAGSAPIRAGSGR